MKRTAEPLPVDAEGLKQLREALKKEDFWSMQSAVEALREVEPSIRAATLREAIAKKKKATTWSEFLAGLAEADEATLSGKALSEKRAEKLLSTWVPDELDEDSTFEMSNLGAEVMRLARFAPAQRERLLAFFENVDPTSREFLELRVEQAEARGDAAEAWRARRSHRDEVMGLVHGATRADKKLVKASTAKVAGLEGDALAVFDEFFCFASPSEREAMVTESLSRLLSGEWEPLPGALLNGLASLKYAGKQRAALKKLVVRDERALKRLLGCLSVAMNDDAIEPVLEDLQDSAGHPLVFAMIERAFQTPGVLAGELCSEWFRGEGKVWEQLTPEQQALVVDGMIAADKAGIDGAHHALFYISAPGGEARVTRELEAVWNEPSSRDTDRRFWSLIHALGHIDTDSSVTTIRQYAFEAVDDGVWECLSTLAETLTRPRLPAHLLAARAHQDPATAHNLLTSMVVEFVKAGGEVERDKAFLEIARSATTWASSPLARFSLLHGLAAALRSYDADAVRELSEALGVTAPDPKKLPRFESRFAVLRGMKPVNPFEGEDVPKDFFKRWAKLLSERPPAKGAVTISGPLTDEAIGAAAGTGVARRLLVAKDQVWFIGEDQRLHGLGRQGPVWEAHLLADVRQTPGALLDPNGHFEDRAIAWRGKGASYVELQQHGRTLFVVMGNNNAWPARHVLTFTTQEQAKQAMTTFRQNLPKDLVLAKDEWFVEGRGGVSREYYERRGKKFETVALSPFSSARTPAELRAEEERLLRDGGTIQTVEWMKHLQRDDEKSFEDWARDRIRDDEQDAAWHLGALDELRTALEAAGVTLEVERAPGSRTHPTDDSVPSQLAETWSQVGRVQVSFDDTTWTFLSFEESRDGAPAFQAQLKKGGDARLAASWPLITVRTPKAESVVVAFDPSGESERCITKVGKSLWWEESLGWVLAVSMLDEVVEAILAKHPLLKVAPRGVSLSDATTIRLKAPGKWWQGLQIGRALGVSFGRDGSPGSFKRTLLDTAELAREQLEKTAAAKRKSGYR